MASLYFSDFGGFSVFLEGVDVARVGGQQLVRKFDYLFSGTVPIEVLWRPEPEIPAPGRDGIVSYQANCDSGWRRAMNKISKD